MKRNKQCMYAAAAVGGSGNAMQFMINVESSNA